MAKKKVYIKIKGIARYPSLHKIDDHGQYPTGKFKVDIIPEPAEMARFKAEFKQLVKENGIPSGGHLPFGIVKDTKDEFVRFRSGYIPAIFDAKNKPFKRGKIVKDAKGKEVPKEQTYLQEIGGGSLLKVRGVIIGYGDKGDITLPVDQVQVVDLKVGGGTSAFDEEDGYTTDDENDSETSSAFTEDDDSETAGPKDDLDI